MKTINTFLIALFVTIFSVTSFSQTDTTINIQFSDFDYDPATSISYTITKGKNITLDASSIDNIIINNANVYNITINDLGEQVDVKFQKGLALHLTVKLIPTSTLDVDDLSNINFNIFPNPTTDFLNISGAQIEVLQVFDVNGRLVLSETPSASNVNLDVRSLETGFYTVLVNNQQTVRFIKE